MKNKYPKPIISTAIGAVLILGGLSNSHANNPRNTADLSPGAQSMAINAEIDGQARGMYLVRLAEPSLATYTGGIDGLEATSAKATGKVRLDTKSSAAKDYKQHLEKSQARVMASANRVLGRQLDPKYTYHYAINGFAAVMTIDEARAMRDVPGVIDVQREKMEKLLTDAGPAWIGAPSVWGQKKSGTKGEGVVVAILDSGINSDHPSFADIGGDGYDHDNPLGSGNYLPGSYCETNPGFCNDKLIGAWDFNPADGPNPEDEDGHGSHTASTVAGNVVNDAYIDAPTTSANFDISGVAPHANMVIYDVCNWTPTGGTCPGSALVAAVDQVIIDSGNLPNGIAALNYSISGGGDPYNDYVELGFLAAVDAGIYVAASAGNSGPGASTVAHLGPWVSTTAASTHNRQVVNTLIDLDSSGGDTAVISGLGLTSGYGPAPIINSADLEADFPGSTLCGLGSEGDFNPPWPAGTFNGEIVACTRGTFGRVEKGANVLAAGAGGYILMDNGGGLVGDAHVLPAVHISVADSATLTAWLATNAGNNPEGTIEGWAFNTDPANGDVIAGFSSRGPQTVFDVLKPDVTAPGVDIMGADADIFAQYQIISGTSMSSPHNAGAGALMTALRPDLTPPEIKSAIMMTASTEFLVKEDGVTPADAFDHGAGRVDLHAAKSAGMVLSETTANFLAANPSLGGDPGALNVPSMMSSNCVGTCSWTRTVSNSENNTNHWNVTASGEGFETDLVVSPQANGSNNLKLKKNQSADITLTANTAFSEEGWHFGKVDLDSNKGNAPDLHMPVAVYASNASDANVFTKTVDTDTASAGDTLTYEINVTNGPMTGPITVTDELPDGTTFVPASETEVVSGGSTTSAWTYDSGTNSMSWTGELDLAGMAIVPVAFAGYLPLSLFVAPTPPPTGCDEGGYGITGLDVWYNGEHYTTAIWSVNGTLELGQASGVTTGYINQPMPSSAGPNNLLAPLWGDMYLCDAGTAGGGNWYFTALSDGVFTWDIFEWEAVPEWPGAGSGSNTFQIWLQRGTSNISYSYGPTSAFFATIGAENVDGTIGDMWYFDGGGTASDPATDLYVVGTPGGSATLGFQVEADCSVDVVNRADLSASGKDETAIAATACD